MTSPDKVVAKALEDAAGCPVTADRKADDPGGMECADCGRIFVGAEWHHMCGICANNLRKARSILDALRASGWVLVKGTGEDPMTKHYTRSAGTAGCM